MLDRLGAKQRAQTFSASPECLTIIIMTLHLGFGRRQIVGGFGRQTAVRTEKGEGYLKGRKVHSLKVQLRTRLEPLRPARAWGQACHFSPQTTRSTTIITLAQLQLYHH
jgi:hypothetical protein